MDESHTQSLNCQASILDTDNCYDHNGSSHTTSIPVDKVTNEWVSDLVGELPFLSRRVFMCHDHPPTVEEQEQQLQVTFFDGAP